MKATYISHMGNDNMVVDAARVSFAKTSDMYSPEQNERLIKYLATHGHESPFAHPHVTFHFEAPIFVARQLAKSQVGFSWNEVSRRYVDDIPEVWHPETLRAKAADAKQGSDGYLPDEKREAEEDVLFLYSDAVICCLQVYEDMIKLGVAPEQARAILPQSTVTEWIWTGSLLGWARVYNLRVKPDAQKETRELVNQIDIPMANLFPVSWRVLTNER